MNYTYHENQNQSKKEMQQNAIGDAMKLEDGESTLEFVPGDPNDNQCHPNNDSEADDIQM